eukprot:TRINITY_DN4258_c0_g1_i1.p1 TRINITY_DN4258_c0_g1~~TRINITY_DN4258_c0_g1_i1.p1  ORF type:complete len:643 (-),score=103.73 TRINITY_DN4258_c0_g1_i1:43-1971(-)
MPGARPPASAAGTVRSGVDTESPRVENGSGDSELQQGNGLTCAAFTHDDRCGASSGAVVAENAPAIHDAPHDAFSNSRASDNALAEHDPARDENSDSVSAEVPPSEEETAGSLPSLTSFWRAFSLPVYDDEHELDRSNEGVSDPSDLKTNTATMALNASTWTIVTMSALSQSLRGGKDPRDIGSALSVRPPRQKDEPRHVRILYFDTGGGHRSAAQSLESALERCYGRMVEVQLEEVSQHLPPPWCYATLIYTWLGNYPTVYEKLWKADDQEDDFRKTQLFNSMKYNSITHIVAKVTEWIDSGDDLILSVHPFCNHLLGDALEELAATPGGGHLNPLVKWATVVTDLGAAHLSWFDPRADAVFVTTDTLKERAVKLRVPASRIHVCGLPVRKGFWDPVNEPKEEWRRRLDLAPPAGFSDKEPLVVLLMGGGEGFGALEATAIAIGERLCQESLGQLVVACGRNEDIRETLSTHLWPSEAFAPKVLGFVGNIDEYMSAADVLVTKAGPGSIAEASIRGLPCLLTSYLPGQEEANVTYVTESGWGEYVSDENPTSVADKLSEWLKDRQLLDRMSRRATELARPHATLEIACRLGTNLLGLEEEDRVSAEHPENRSGELQQEPLSAPSKRGLGSAAAKDTAEGKC